MKRKKRADGTDSEQVLGRFYVVVLALGPPQHESTTFRVTEQISSSEEAS